MWAFLLPPLAKKVPSYITPNHISVAGFIFVLASAFFLYATKYNYFYYLAAALSSFIYAMVDSLDGTLARIRHQISRRGVFLDYTLDKIAYLLLLFAFMLSGQVRADLVVIVMIFGLFYSLTNMESQVLTGRQFSVGNRPQGLAVAITLCFVAFFLKFFRLDLLEFYGFKFRSLDTVFVIMPVFQVVLILSGCISLWKELKKLDRERKK